MSAAVFGPIIGGTQVRLAVLDTLQLWLPAYLAEVERQAGYEPGTLGQPRSWRRPPDVWKIGDQQSPAIMVLPPVWQQTPEVEGARRGQLHTTWRVAVACAVSVGGADPDWSGQVVSDYLTAVWALLEQQASLGGFAEQTRCIDQDAALLQRGDQRQRSLAAGSVTASVTVRGALQRRDGPVDPPADPYVDPGDWPQVTDTDTEVEGQP